MQEQMVCFLPVLQRSFPRTAVVPAIEIQIFTSEVLTAVTTKIAILCYVNTCSSAVHRHFGETYSLHVHAPRINQRGTSKNQPESKKNSNKWLTRKRNNCRTRRLLHAASSFDILGPEDGGRGSLRISIQLHAVTHHRTNLFTARFITGVKFQRRCWTGGWVGPRAGMGAVKMRKISFLW
jgi:hypothetical protein